jgi:hypothetical protein
MLRSHDLRLYGNTNKKLMRSVAVEYPGRYMAGVYRRRFKILYGVIALSSDVLPYLALGAALVSGSLVSLICVAGWCLLRGPGRVCICLYAPATYLPGYSTATDLVSFLCVLPYKHR